MNSNDIQCEWHSEKKRLFYVDENLDVLPCCFYATKSAQLRDLVFKKHSIETPDWNNLAEHTLEEIMNHEIYQTHLWHPGWEGTDPSPVCLRSCGSKMTQQRSARKKV